MIKKNLLCAILLSGICLSAVAQPKVVGHRGCRTPGYPYENTINALKFAQSLGIYAAEFDINLTKDDELIVVHGPKVPGYDKDVRNMTFAEAMKVVLPDGQKIPTLKEWLTEAKNHPEMKIIMEIKGQLNAQKETKAVEMSMSLIKEMGMEDQLEYTTFSEWCCQEIHRVNPKAKVLFLMSGVGVHDAKYAKEKAYDGISYNLDAMLNKPALIDQARELGIETTLWLVNDYEVADWAIRHKVDYISTDNPEKLQKYMNAVLQYLGQL